MPTRYTLELEGLKNAVTSDTFKEVSQREDAKKTVKKAFDERYQSGKNRWFFTPLRMYTGRDWRTCRNDELTAGQVSRGCADVGWIISVNTRDAVTEFMLLANDWPMQAKAFSPYG